jgi:hypothetical protein
MHHNNSIPGKRKHALQDKMSARLFMNSRRRTKDSYSLRQQYGKVSLNDVVPYNLKGLSQLKQREDQEIPPRSTLASKINIQMLKGDGSILSRSWIKIFRCARSSSCRILISGALPKGYNVKYPKNLSVKITHKVYNNSNERGNFITISLFRT